MKTVKRNLNSFRTILSILFLLVFTSFKLPFSHYNISRVVIDAGHGGHDSGCLGVKTKEKDVALAVALKLGHYIEEHYPDVKVIYTRKTDVFVELHQRAEIANNAKADLFICIHCNSACYRDKKKKKEICNEDSYGVETWVMGLHVAGANLEVAKRENAVVLLEKDYQKKYDGFDPNSPEANIIFSLYQNTFLDQSLRLASFVENEVKRNGREPRGVKQAGFLVLYQTNMPSVLVETGFLTNPSEEAYLASGKGQDAMAHSIFNAFKSYKTSVESGEVEKIAVTPNPPKVEEPVPATKDTPAAILPAAKKDTMAAAVVNADTPSIYKPAPSPKRSGDGAKKIKPDTVVLNAASHNKEKPEPTVVYEFSVQILLSPTPLKPANAKFKGVKNIHEEKENNLFKYTTERLKTFEEASDVRTTMQGKGFKDAFVVAYKNGKRISPVQARQEMKK